MHFGNPKSTTLIGALVLNRKDDAATQQAEEIAGRLTGVRERVSERGDTNFHR